MYLYISENNKEWNYVVVIIRMDFSTVDKDSTKNSDNKGLSPDHRYHFFLAREFTKSLERKRKKLVFLELCDITKGFDATMGYFLKEQFYKYSDELSLIWEYIMISVIFQDVSEEILEAHKKG